MSEQGEFSILIQARCEIELYLQKLTEVSAKLINNQSSLSLK